jgi:SNF2 family DNA or RNA helicase
MGAQVLLATAETGGYGLSLNEASAMVFYSVGYDWEVYTQACDRNQRVGQTAKCTVFQLLCSGSVDVKISEILRKKGRLRDLILD